MHSGAAAGGELLLTDPSLLPRQSPHAQARAPSSPDARSYYEHGLPPGLGAYQVHHPLLFATRFFTYRSTC